MSDLIPPFAAGCKEPGPRRGPPQAKPPEFGPCGDVRPDGQREMRSGNCVSADVVPWAGPEIAADPVRAPSILTDFAAHVRFDAHYRVGPRLGRGGSVSVRGPGEEHQAELAHLNLVAVG